MTLSVALFGTDPAAGSEITVTVPAGERWTLRSIHFQLVTDATVANRRANLVIDDGTNVILAFNSAQDHAASTTRDYYYSNAGTDTGVVGGTQRITIPDKLVLPAGYRIITSTTAFQAGDNYGGLVILYIKNTDPDDVWSDT